MSTLADIVAREALHQTTGHVKQTQSTEYTTGASHSQQLYLGHFHNFAILQSSSVFSQWIVQSCYCSIVQSQS